MFFSNLATALARDSLELCTGNVWEMKNKESEKGFQGQALIWNNRALDVQTGEVVAIKRIKLEDVGVDHEIMASTTCKCQRDILWVINAAFQLLQQEVDLLKDMESPNIVRYLGSVRDDTYLNILLE